MSKLKYFESFYNRLNGPVICMIFLMVLPLIFIIPANDILTSLAKTDVVQQFNMPVKGALLTLEFCICCSSVFLCWGIIEIHRQRSNKFFEKLLTVANDVDLTTSQQIQDNLLLKKSIKLVEQTVEDYAMLLLMINKHSPNFAIQNPAIQNPAIQNPSIQNFADSKELVETQKALMEEPPCIMPAELGNI